MQPSAIVAFAVGAALASGIVYVTVKPKAETLIRVESPVIAEQPPAQAPNAEREKPSPVARVLVPPAAAPPAKKSQKKPETPSASLPLTGSAAHLQLVSQRFPLTAPVRAELLPVPPPPPEPVQ
jgi:hypothetical protein